ncbi:MAG: hypothetical protein IIV97_04080 [Oscillospiraceae bacterium]|nr:hypothetical protein [Oscillospiraceae bacterium]
MNNNKKKKDITENMKRDYVTNKLLLVFTLAFALLLLFTNIGRMMKSTVSYMTAWNIAKIASGISVAIVVAGIIMLIVEKAKGIDTRFKLLSGKNITVVGVIFAICSVALSLVFSSDMLMLLYVFIPALVVLYIIFYSYPRDFFMIALSVILSGVAIWLLISDLVNSADIAILAIAAAIIVILAIFTIIAQVKGGTIKLFGREVTLFRDGAKYALTYLTYLLSVMLLVAAFLAFDLAIYFVFGLIGYILLIGVYYTVKLI